jgi:hypothetical protein
MRPLRFCLQVDHLRFAICLLVTLGSLLPKAYSQASSVPACSSSSPSQTPKAGAIKGQGCVIPGTEGGCLIVRDRATGTRYNLFFLNGQAPAIDTAIRFVGKAHSGPTTCMEGTAVEVTSCTVLRLHCPDAEVDESATYLADAADFKCKDWRATYKEGLGSLHVSAACTVQNGTTLTLTPHIPPGFNPKIYILNLRASKPSQGSTSQLMVPFSISYDEQTKTHYESVYIGDHGPNVVITQVH